MRSGRVKAGLRIGIMGGSFNPPHLGHLVISEQAREMWKLDRVLFVPAHTPPHKIGRAMVDPRHRLRMVKLAIRGNKALGLTEFEISRQGISYTVDTVRYLKAEYRHSELFLIIGSDSLAEYHEWKNPGEISAMARLLVYPRAGYEMNSRFPAGSDAELIRGPILNISSTDIRGRVARGETIRYLVPPEVERYIRLHKLYRHSE